MYAQLLMEAVGFRGDDASKKGFPLNKGSSGVVPFMGCFFI